jgi:hypothetical protein
MDKTRAIIDYAYEDNAKEMRDALYSAIHDKVMDHIELHKKEIAKSLITQEDETQEPEEVN